MAPYQEAVLQGGRLEVWSTEWEVTWDNDRPQTARGLPDLRYSHLGTRLTRAKTISLVEALPTAWQSAQATATALGSSAGIFQKPVPGGPIIIEVSSGRPALIIRDIRRIASQHELDYFVSGLHSLVSHADAKQVEVHRFFHHEGVQGWLPMSSPVP